MGFKRVPRRKMSTDGVIDLRFFERVAISREMTTSFLAIWRVCGNLFLGSRSSVPIPAAWQPSTFFGRSDFARQSGLSRGWYGKHRE